MKLLFNLFLIYSCWLGCNEKLAIKMLSERGYTSINITGNKAHVCDNLRYDHTRFQAINPSRQFVVGTVCSGFGEPYIQIDQEKAE